MKAKAYAKLNLGLHVLKSRDDGFHDIETVFLKVGWHDTLHFTGSHEISMSCSDPVLPTDERNLCVRAARDLIAKTALQANSEIAQGAQISLTKEIPYGAGLGGGSSDAATTLLSLNDLLNAGLTPADLLHLGSELGSDVPFFLGEGIAYGQGRGEVLEVVGEIRALDEKHLAIVVPDVRVSTEEAYAGVAPFSEGRADLKSLVSQGSLADWRARLVNDFEPSVMRKYPAISELKKSFYEAGAEYASMSGSGSAVFGVFGSVQAASSFVDARPRGYRCWFGEAETAH